MVCTFSFLLPCFLLYHVLYIIIRVHCVQLTTLLMSCCILAATASILITTVLLCVNFSVRRRTCQYVMRHQALYQSWLRPHPFLVQLISDVFHSHTCYVLYITIADTCRFQFLVLHTLVPSIKRGLRSKNEVLTWLWVVINQYTNS